MVKTEADKPESKAQAKPESEPESKDGSKPESKDDLKSLPCRKYRRSWGHRRTASVKPRRRNGWRNMAPTRSRKRKPILS